MFIEKDPTKRLELLGYAKKLAHRHAYENAFRRVIIISLDNGKVGVEINQQNMHECSFYEPGEDGTVHVNHIEEMPDSDSDEEHNTQIELQNASNSSLACNGVVS